MSYSDSEEDNDGDSEPGVPESNNADADAVDTPVQALPENTRFGDSSDTSMNLTPAFNQRSSEANHESPVDDTPEAGSAPGHWHQHHSAPPFVAADTMFLPLAGREQRSSDTPQATPPPKSSLKKTSPGSGSISGSKIKGSFSVER